MAVQVNEIIIRATVNEGGDAHHAHETKKKSSDNPEKEALVSECVEQVLDILRKELKR